MRRAALAAKEDSLELALQFGHGMMDHSRTLLRSWGDGNVILGPRALEPDQLPRFAEQARTAGGAVLLDPQFYLPHADHARLTSHDYWPDQYATTNFWAGPELQALLQRIEVLNASLGCFATILPGVYAPHVDEEWLA